MSRRHSIFVGIMAALLGGSVATRADILVRSDGGLLDGKVVSQTAKEVVFQTDGADVLGVQHFDRQSVSRVLITDEHGGLISDSAAPATQPASRWNVPPDPLAPPIVAPGTTPTYIVIPLHGEVGQTVLASALEKSLADAVKRKPTVVVLDIDSPGGLVEEAKQIIDVLHHYNKKLRIVAITKQDLSAAAIFSLSVREIYVKSSSTIGAATSFVPSNLILPPKIEEKMQSAWRAVARNSAEEGRHEPLLADAMIDNDSELHLETVAGKPVVKEGPGDKVLCRKGKILTLSSHEAVDCGLAAGEADDLDELGTALKLPNWTEMKGLGTALAESLPKRADAYKAETEKIHARFAQDLQAAVTADPSESVTSVTRVTRVGPQQIPGRPVGPMIPGRHIIPQRPGVPGTGQETVTVIRHRNTAHWKADSLACVIALQKVEADVKDAGSLADAFGRASDVEAMKDASERLSAIRSAIFDDRNKYNNAASANASDAANPSQPGSNPAVPPQHHTVTMPPGSVKTEIVGGKGGGGYITIMRDDKPVVGFRYTFGSWGGKQTMKVVAPISANANPSSVPDLHEIAAKDGYVVSGLIVDANETNVVAFKVIFIAYANGKTNPKDTYQSDWQGTPDSNATKTLGGNGEIVRGTVGRRGMNQDALGLVVMPADQSTTRPAGGN